LCQRLGERGRSAAQLLAASRLRDRCRGSGGARDCRDPGNAACSSVARPSSCGRSGNICRTAALPASRLVLACFSLRAIDSRSTNRRPRSSMKRCTSLRSAGQPLDLIDHDRRGPRKRPQPVGKERRIAQVRLIEPFVQEIDSSGHGQDRLRPRAFSRPALPEEKEAPLLPAPGECGRTGTRSPCRHLFWKNDRVPEAMSPKGSFRRPVRASRRGARAGRCHAR
jgi:hypothetical protein